MLVRDLEVFTYPVPFKRVFRHASASRRRAENLIVALHAAGGDIGFGEGCPREYVTGETAQSCAAFVREHSASFCAAAGTVEGLRGWIEANRGSIDDNPAAVCAMEIAALDLLGKVHGCSVEDVLGVTPDRSDIAYSAVLGDMPMPVYRWQFRNYRGRGFSDFKVKLSGSARRDRAKLAVFANGAATGLRVRLDANNLWESAGECIDYMHALPDIAFAIEEPLRAGDTVGCEDVARERGVQIIADESLRRTDELATFADPARWIANVRVSKMGGIIRSLEVVAEAARLGIGVIVGCQVGETSVLSRAALAVIASAPAPVVAAEGAFGTHLLSRDLTTRTIMWGHGGVLECGQLFDSDVGGLGLVLDPAARLEPPPEPRAGS
ncbi:enolase C-terminal domain-like protein [Candidatus Poriferisodalis sp.]|uniref:enolase C-terminal domain-like protein n=1 Tax=Candidatus Poriferisodalis sp. TaxID=3101277 RepID=UPI003D09B351